MWHEHVSLRHLLLAAAACLAMAVAGPSASAQTTGKPTRIVVPFAAGSTTDIIARILAGPLGQALGTATIVENKPGADGAIAAADVKRAPADGSTLFVATNSPMSAAPHLQKGLAYDPLTDFTPIGHVGNYTFFLVVHADVPARSFAEFVAHAKAKPDALNYGSGNTSSISFTGTLTSLADIKLVHVPYKSEPPAVLDLIAGRIQVMVSSYSTVAAHIRDGKLRPLLVFLPERSPVLPEVPSVAEVGLPRFVISSFCALYGPAGMSRGQVAAINRALEAVLQQAEVREQLLKQAFVPNGSSPDALAAFTAEQLKVWGEALRAAGISPQ